MRTESRIESLLMAWQEAQEGGRSLPLEELCRDCPELREELERRLVGLRQVNELLTTPARFRRGETEDSAPLRPAQPAEPLSGELGGYRVIRLLGAGGMGEVYEAEDPALGRRVALKVMRGGAGGTARSRFLREARAAAALSHDHVVSIYQVGEDGGVPFIAMPLLRGEALEARLAREGALPAAEVMRIGREAALGLAAAHEAGLVHRDVKPANLWLEGPSGRVKVLDFGVARPREEGEGLTQPGAVLGTPGYMPPEQVEGRALDGRADLFALGCVLYRAATGRAAFQGASALAVLQALGGPGPPPPHDLRPEVPQGLSELITRLLAKRPEDRYATASDVARDLAALEAGQPPGEATRTGTPSGAGGARPKGLRVSLGWRVPGCTVALTVTLAGLLVVVGVLRFGQPSWQPGSPPAAPPSDGPPVHYRGAIHVLVERETEPGARRMLRLDDPRALPLRREDRFRIVATVSPPAYLYLIWVDPGQDVTPVYPWDPTKGWGSRPARERLTGQVSLPPAAGDRYTAPDARPGVATMVVLARPTPLDVPDEVVRGWFEALPDLPLPAGGEGGAVWFDNYAVVAGDVGRSRTFKVVGTDDPFAAWQGKLQKAVGDRASFQTAVSFARTGGR